MYKKLLNAKPSPGVLQRGYDVLGGYLSPVNDAYSKPGLAPAVHRVAMCRAAATSSPLVMVDAWEAQQPDYVRTLRVLERLAQGLNAEVEATPSVPGVCTSSNPDVLKCTI